MAATQAGLMTHFATRSPDRFAGIGWQPGLDGMPVLADEVPLRLECRVAHRLPIGDHTYLIGEVVRMTAADAVPMTLQR
jgi:3-hydroxy-9,10-secoandrosta-1,3,5(10)-triene-9,17-dione monooxygenase reductase component